MKLVILIFALLCLCHENLCFNLFCIQHDVAGGFGRRAERSSVAKMEGGGVVNFPPLYLKLNSVRLAIPRIWTRPFNHLPLHGAGAEIGVYRGYHADELLRRHKAIRLLYLCDAYVPYGGVQSGECPKLQQASRTCFALLSKNHSGRFQRVFQNSPECAAFLPAQLDFCYIDGGHDYDAVKRDVETMWPLVKPGGVLGGHDFCNGFPGVIKAVTEFAVFNAIRLNVETPDWWMFKP